MHFHDPRAFWLFLTLAILQTFIALDSGILAVFALPRHEFPRRKRRLQYLLLTLTALAVFGVTFTLGTFADRDQYEAKQRAIKAEAGQSALQLGLNNTNQVLATVQAIVSSAGKKGLSSGDLTRIARIVKPRLAANDTLLAEPHVTNQPIIPPVANPIPAPQTPLAQGVKPAQTAQVSDQITRTLQTLTNLDQSSRSRLSSMMSGIRGTYITGQKSDAEKARDLVGLAPALQGLLRDRSDTFGRLMREVERERNEVRTLTRSSRADDERDEVAYQQALASCNATVTVPNSWMQAGPLYSVSYSSMINYLTELQKRLPKQ